MAASALRKWLPTALRSLAPSSRKSTMKRVGVRIAFETLEARDVPNAAFDLIHLSGTGGARGDARFSAVDGSGGGTTKQSVVIIDTGLDQTHPLLSGNFEVGFDFFGPDARRDGATVTGDHGTHVSGTVGSTDPEIGVANGVGLIGLNVFGATQDGLRAPNNDIEEALRWVIDNKATYNIVAVNMSLGGGRFESLTADAKNSQLTDEITQLESQGVVVVTAAGNNYKRQNGNEVGQLSSPAIVSTIAVGSVWQDGVNSGVQWGSGATDNTTAPDQIVSHSNRLRAGSLGGTDYVDTLFAPGAIINSTVPGGGIEGMAGTSMASPHIAGIVALVQDAATRFLGHQLGALQVRDILFNTADTVSDTDTDNHDNVVNTGLTYRRVNVERALAFVFDQKAQLPTPPPPIPPGQTPPPPPETGTDPNGTIYGAVSSNFTLEAPVTIQGNLGTDYGVPVGSASTFGDVDIFRFVVAPGQDNTPIRIDVAGVADANFDTYLRVFDQAGTEISVNDDVGSGKLYSSLSVTLPAGTYYAGVSAYPNYNYNPFIAGSGSQAPSGTYSINFQSDLVDPNGTRYSAVPLFQDANGRFQSVDENIGLDYGVGYDKFAKPLTVRSDVDMYALVAPDDGTITFDVLAFRGGVQPNIPGGLPDSYLRVWRNYVAVDTTDGSAAPADYAFNDDIDFSIRNFDSRIVQFPVHAGDLIHIGVSGFGNGHYNPDSLENRLSDVNTGNYRLSATFDSTDLNGYIETVDDHNINTGATNATRLTNDPDLFIYQQRGNIGIDRFADANGQPQESKSGQDVDLVQFTFPATFSNGSTTAVFQFALESFGVNFAGVPGIENPVDGIVTLFNAAGEPLAQIDDTYDDKGNFLSLDPTLSYTVEAGQTYYVGISGYSNFGYNPHFAGSGSSGSTGDYLFTAEVISLGEVRGKTDNKAGKSNPSIILGETIAGRIGSDSVAATLNNKAAGTTTAIQSTLNDPDTQDVDFRRFTATGTGIMDVRVLAFEDFNASNGTIRVFRSNADMTPGDVIPSTLVDIGPISGGAVRFRATNGETYFIGVTGKAFQASGSFDGKTTIPLSPADRNNPNVVLDAGGYNLSVNALPTLDADGDGTAGGSNDAILLSRYVNGLEAEVLADGITFGAGATRRTGEAIAAYFDGFANVRNMAFDGNGDGKGGGSDDAILARRFVNGLESEVLSDGITFGILAQRRAGSDVAEYFMPLTNTGGAGGRVAAPGGHTPAGRVRIAGPQLSAADDTPPAITAPGVAMWSAPADAAGTPAGLTSGDGTGEQAAADTTTPAAAAAPGDDDHAEPTLADLPADAVWLQGVFVG